jgi:hypothetical protein
VALFSYLSRIIDLAQARRQQFFSEHSRELIWMAVVALVLRPLFFGLHDLLVHQTISPGQPDPLAEPQLCAQAEPELLPERLRRAHRPAHHADRQLLRDSACRRWTRCGTWRSTPSVPWCCSPRPTGA